MNVVCTMLCIKAPVFSHLVKSRPYISNNAVGIIGSKFFKANFIICLWQSLVIIITNLWGK